FFLQAEDGIRGFHVTGVQTCALPISLINRPSGLASRSPRGRNGDRPRDGRHGGGMTAVLTPSTAYGLLLNGASHVHLRNPGRLHTVLQRSLDPLVDGALVFLHLRAKHLLPHVE